MKTAKRKAGRPPAGIDGAPSSQYPQLAVRVPQDTIDQLAAIAAKKGLRQWQVVREAMAKLHRQTFR